MAFARGSASSSSLEGIESLRPRRRRFLCPDSASLGRWASSAPPKASLSIRSSSRYLAASRSLNSSSRSFFCCSFLRTSSVSSLSWRRISSSIAFCFRISSSRFFPEIPKLSSSSRRLRSSSFSSSYSSLDFSSSSFCYTTRPAFATSA